MKSAPTGSKSVMVPLPEAVRVTEPLLASVATRLPFRMMPADVDFKLMLVPACITPFVWMSPPEVVTASVPPAVEAPRFNVPTIRLLLMLTFPLPLVLADKLFVVTKIGVVPPMAPVPLERAIVVAANVLAPVDIAPVPPAVRVMLAVLPEVPMGLSMVIVPAEAPLVLNVTALTAVSA